MKTYTKGNRRVWYDPNLRLWTEQLLDDNGNQIGSVDYDVSREDAMAWLNGDGLSLAGQQIGWGRP